MGQMDRTRGRFDDVCAFIGDVYGGDLHTKRIGSLAGATLGVMTAASLAVAATFVGFMAAWAAIGTYDSWAFGQLADGLVAIPMWIPQSTFVAGSVLLLVAMLDEFVVVMVGDRPTYVQLAEARHAAGDFSSEV